MDRNGGPGLFLASIQVFTDVLDGKTLRQAADAHGIGRTTAEKRLRTIERALRSTVQIHGYLDHAPVPLAVMRQHKSAYLGAVARLSIADARPAYPLRSRALNDLEISRIAEAARQSKGCMHRDVALVYALFGTGATPLEIAQLKIRDYLQPDGDVQRLSSIRKEIAFNGAPRPLIWTEKVIGAVEEYLQNRATKRQGLHGSSDYRGFDPDSALFLTEGGTAFQIRIVNRGKGEHHLCHSLLDLYRRIFLRSGIAGASTRSARRTIAYKLSLRGATEEEIGMALGIKRMDCVRALLPKTRPSIPMLMHDLV